VVTNWAVWQFSFLYQHNWLGLTQTYLMAVPFFRNTLVGDLIYLFGFVGAVELFCLARKFKKEKSFVYQLPSVN
jgi:hypothetical protein